MKRNLVKLALLFSLSMNLAVVAAFSYQRARASEDTEPSRASTGDPFAALDLDDEQTRAFDRLRAEYRDYRGECHHQMGGMRKTLLAQLTSESPDRESIGRTLTAMRDRQAATQRRLVEHLLELRSVLRPDQRPAFDLVLEKNVLGSRLGRGGKCKHAIHE